MLTKEEVKVLRGIVEREEGILELRDNMKSIKS